MKFKEAFEAMLCGCKITLPEWEGYCHWKNGQIQMILKSGEVIYLKYTSEWYYTLANICREGWKIIE